MGTKEDKKFLIWMANRLLHKHGYSKDDMIISKLLEMSSKTMNSNISDKDLDLIISKYYVDFFLEKTNDLNIGYTADERERLRKHIKCLVFDINNKNIPKDVIK